MQRRYPLHLPHVQITSNLGKRQRKKKIQSVVVLNLYDKHWMEAVLNREENLGSVILVVQQLSPTF